MDETRKDAPDSRSLPEPRDLWAGGPYRPITTAETEPPRRERMASLASLPVFYSLRGKPVAMVGGGAGAAWKAELLAAAGAVVHLYAPSGDLDAEMVELLADRGETPPAASASPAGACPGRHPGAFPDLRFGGSALDAPAAGAPERAGKPGRILHHDRPWAWDVFAGMGLAVCDCEDMAEGRAFACAARAAGVPVNVVDKPAYCDFQFGSIVNRSPVVVSISTDGAAPILGQAIRRRIETLLPPALAAWAGLAQRVRTRVMERLTPGPARRAFWERLTDKAFATRAPEPADEAEADALIADLARSPAAGGRVTLVGAGPGEAELLTLQAVRALQAADVILFDDLVSDGVLELARREAKRMLVGKRAARESCRQEDINAMMVSLARAGKHVVRLKSGDVSIFGRAGEELADLEAHGIPVTIVPGITAAAALASTFGVSLTHRDRASQVRFVTGHSKKGGLPEDVKWASLADSEATTVFYMGGRMAGRIAERLIAHGLPDSTPVAVAANLSRADQTSAAGRLVDLAEIVGRIGFDRPILIAVGRVFEEHAQAAADPRRPGDTAGTPARERVS